MVCRWYEIEGFRFGIRTTSHAFSDWLEYVLAAYRSPSRPDDDGSAATYSIVIEDPEEDGRQRKFHIMYLGGWDIVRTLDLGSMAECVYRDLESILYPVRDDYVFLELGPVDMAGALGLVAPYVIPALNRSARRGAKYGVSTPGGVYAPLQLGTGVMVRPAPVLDVPADAIASLARFMDVADRTERDPFFEPRPVDVIFDRVYVDGVQGLSHPPRGDLFQAVFQRVRNAGVLGGVAFETVAETVRNSEVWRGWYGSTNEMYEMYREVGRAVHSP